MAIPFILMSFSHINYFFLLFFSLYLINNNDRINPKYSFFWFLWRKHYEYMMVLNRKNNGKPYFQQYDTVSLKR